MSKFLSEKFSALTPYTPGEQPKDMKYVKLNTNESPFPPSQTAIDLAAQAARDLELYPDPECRALTQAVADHLNVDFNQVLLTNGSDEILNFAFMAYCDENTPAVFPNITYGFYSVFAELNRVPYTELPLRDDFTVDVDAFCNARGTIFLANPNAPTGIELSQEDVVRILESDPDRIVVIDEAYVDFGAKSAVSLLGKYPNLLVTQTFSKSRSMAGARLGFGVASAEIIGDLNTIKYSTNPYNINRMTMAAGLGTMQDAAYTAKNCRTVAETRAYTAEKLKALGFEMTESKANFLFAKHPKLDGGKTYLALKEAGILVRHFTKPELSDYNRITVGSREQMDILLSALTRILEESV